MPDLFHGDPVPLNNRPASFDLMSWLKGPPGHLPDRVEPVVQAILKEMKSNMGCERVGAVGYCFGVCSCPVYAVLLPELTDTGKIRCPIAEARPLRCCLCGTPQFRRRRGVTSNPRPAVHCCGW